MAKTKPQDTARKSRKSKKGSSQHNGTSKKPKTSPEQLLSEAVSLLQTSQAEASLVQARRALAILQPSEEPRLEALPALNLLGEICVELGDIDTAREYFGISVELDPEGEVSEANGGGPEKFLWLAQLSEEGGADSVGYFEQGTGILRRQIATLEDMPKRSDTQNVLLEEKKRKMANAFCSIAEVYMTDLSWEEEAEARCEAMVTEAMLIAPTNPEVLQTLANIRLSQAKLEDAQSALSRSLELWRNLPPEDEKVPDFPTRISLSRLLIEAELHDDAIEVLERLVTEDDSSIEAWYLGGWCLYLTGQSQQDKKAVTVSADNGDAHSTLKTSRRWLHTALKLYQTLEYEDERLRDHAVELVDELNKILGTPSEDDVGDDDEWEDGSSQGGSDEEMEGT